MNRLNDRGQALTLFVIFVPVIIMVGVLATDMSYARYQSRKLDNINKEVIKYGLNHLSDDPYNDMVDLIYKNDDEIDSYEINIDNLDQKINVVIKKSTTGFFGKIIGKDIYEEKSSYEGKIIDNKISIKKGDLN